MTAFNSRRIVLALLVITVASGILLTACGGPACGRLCEVDFWLDEDYVSTNPSVAAVQAELDKGPDVNAENDDGMTPLRFAFFRGSPEVVELLLDHGADARAGQESLCLILGNEDAIARKAELLFDRGADVNFTCPNGQTPFTWAVFVGKNVPLVQTMILYGADVNARDEKGNAALGWALVGSNDAAANREEIVRLLLQYGADPNTDSSEGTLQGDSPLHIAVIFADVGAVQALLDHGANPDAKDSDGETPCDLGRDLASSPSASEEWRAAWEEIGPLVCR